MKKILNYIPNWLLTPLVVIVLFIFWPIIFIITGIIWLFSKKTTDSEKIIGAKMVILTIVGLVIFGAVMESMNYLEGIFNVIGLPILIIILIVVSILVVLQKFFPKNKWLNKDIEDKSQQKNNKYEFINEDGKKEVYTIGYEKNGKFDIYWEDIVASKNNKNGIVLPDGTGWMDDNVDENNTKLINKKCSFCMGNVDRFIYVNNFSKNDGDYGDVEWMEVCWKCEKVLYLDTSLKD